MQNITDLTRRLDTQSYEMAILKTRQDGYSEKVEDIKEELRGFRRGIFWLNTTVWGAIILVAVKFVADGGLSSVAKAAGLGA